MIDIASLMKQVATETHGGLPRVDIEFLLSYYLNKPRSWLYAFSEHQLDDEQIAEIQSLIKRRLNGEPIAYITGRRGFWSFDLQVTSDTLIPRPETELLVELALARIRIDQTCQVLDLGTGTGAIALVIAEEYPNAMVTAVDVSEAALQVAKRNAVELKIRNIEFTTSDWFKELKNQRFDLIVSNPPYIETTDAHLQQGDLRFEPKNALASGEDGLDAIRIIIAGAKNHLNRNAWLMIEHGWNQGEKVRKLFADAGFFDIHTEQDLQQHERVTMGQLVV
jgi:release factor glutamine methyltransferase